MSQVLEELLELLRLTRIDQQTFKADCQDLGFRALFGGQVLGQSLSAAIQTLDDDQWQPHSLHSYFLRAGTVADELIIHVENLRDGRSFATRQVKVSQNDKLIFTMTCSFQRPEEGFEHQPIIPEVKGPEGIPSQLELARMFRDYFPERVRDIYTADKPLEMRVLDPVNIFSPTKKDPIKYVWMKSDADMSGPLFDHFALMAYATDFNLLPTALHPHAVSIAQKDMQVASLDHSIWFHRPFRMDDWLLYAIDSPTATGGRGFCRGQIFNRDGDLVASVSQEGLMRQRLND